MNPDFMNICCCNRSAAHKQLLYDEATQSPHPVCCLSQIPSMILPHPRIFILSLLRMSQHVFNCPMSETWISLFPRKLHNLYKISINSTWCNWFGNCLGNYHLLVVQNLHQNYNDQVQKIQNEYKKNIMLIFIQLSCIKIHWFNSQSAVEIISEQNSFRWIYFPARFTCSCRLV